MENQVLNKVNRLKYLCTFCVICLLFSSMHVQAQISKPISISIENTSSENIEDKVVEIPWKSILTHDAFIDTSKLSVVNESSRPLLYQLEHKGTTSVQNLLVQVSVPAHKKIILKLKTGKNQSSASKTYCRFVPERYDDFAWENDRVAFRMYGKALEATTFNAYGIDVWAKRTTKLVVDRWYKSGDYHTDHGEGLDFYGVGFSLGAGDGAPYLNDSIHFPKNYSSYKVLDNGPLRSSFQLIYNSWTVGKYGATVTKVIQLDAGHQLNKIEATYTFSGIDRVPVVVGINKQRGADIKLLNEQHGLMGYWPHKDSTNGTIAIGVVFTGNDSEMKFAANHLLGVQMIKTGEPFVYYTGAAWDKAGHFTNASDWFSYLQEFKNQLENPLKVNVY